MSFPGPTIRPPSSGGLNAALGRNIAALRERREREAGSASTKEKVAAAIARFTGSLWFVYIHLAIYSFWIVANLGWLGLMPWDPTFVVLAMIASVEAIFLSTFVLINQNRMAAQAEKRAELDLQINLLAEHEVTRLMAIVSAIAARLCVAAPDAGEVDELERDVAAEAVLDAIEGKEQ